MTLPQLSKSLSHWVVSVKRYRGLVKSALGPLVGIPLKLTSISQPLDNLGDCGSLLSNSNVDAVQLGFLICSLVEPLLVDDGVNGYGRLSCLSVTNDQLSLSTSNGHQTVYSLNSCLHGFSYRDSGDDTWGLYSYTSPLGSVKWSLQLTI